MSVASRRWVGIAIAATFAAGAAYVALDAPTVPPDDKEVSVGQATDAERIRAQTLRVLASQTGREPLTEDVALSFVRRTDDLRASKAGVEPSKSEDPLFGVSVSDAEAAAYFASHKSMFGGRSLDQVGHRVRKIVRLRKAQALMDSGP